jgi:hypothetical protein
MNICMLTTWNSSCGIAEYSRNLIKEYIKLGHNIIILNNVVESQSIKNNVSFVSSRVFGVYWWGETPAFDCEKAWDMMNYFERVVGPIDVLHVQYQSSLYEPQGFNKFIRGIKNPTKRVITIHDSSVNHKHKLNVFDSSIVHRPMGKKYTIEHYVLEMPTVEKTPKVFSFGMGGRNDYNFIQNACEEIGVKFEKHDGRENGWLSEHSLFVKMKEADAIVLWYNEVAIQGQSAALRTAISSNRPVIVNNVRWFDDAPYFVRRVSTKDDLQIVLAETLNLEYIRKCSYKKLAERHLEIYEN